MIKGEVLDIYNIFPFSAVVGQDDIKKALIWNVVNPKIGGVLICGEKGTAKSTLVRSLCDILEGVKVVELPLNITEDSLVGSIDLEYALKYGKKKFEYGLLKKADGNILYIDEVNLISDHIVKSLIDSASSGVNKVEREGISFSHNARFILMGSMNPEEGSLRPQFLDRFGLYVDVKSESDIKNRMEIIRRRMEFELNDKDFIKEYLKENKSLASHILRARNALSEVEITENAIKLAITLSKNAHCEGHRAEYIMVETARTIAAWDFRKMINIEDIKEASRFVLPHRMRDLEENLSTSNMDDNHTSGNDNLPNEEDTGDNSNIESSINQTEDMESLDDEESNEGKDNFTHDQPQFEDSEKVDSPDETFDVSRWLVDKSKRNVNKGSGRRSLVRTSLSQGRYVRSRIPMDDINDIAFDATIRAAAPYQRFRDRDNITLSIQSSDIRVKVREKRTGNTILFVVDASGSMGANKRMKSVKGAILSLLNDAYQKRDKVGLIVFRKQTAELILNITRSVELAQKEMLSLPTGGRTPLSAGLDLAYEVIKSAKIKDRDIMPVIVLVLDGRATYCENSNNPFSSAIESALRIRNEKIKSIVIDADESFIKLNLSEKIAEALGADLFKIEDLRAEDLVSAVKISV